MDIQIINFITKIPLKVASLSVFTSFKENVFIKYISQIVMSCNNYTNCKELVSQKIIEVINLYTLAFNYLNKTEFCGNLADYIFDYTLYDENFVLEQSSKNNYLTLSSSTKDAFSKDIEFLNEIAYLSSQSMKEFIKIKILSVDTTEDIEEILQVIQELPSWENNHKKFKINNKNWSCQSISIAENAKKNGVGIFAKHSVFTVGDDGNIYPVENYCFKPLETISGYEKEREKLIINTKAFCESKKFNNVLLYGDRGTGKSTAVKSVFSEFRCKNLKLIEISKSNLCFFRKIIKQLSKQNNKFIIFIDDLSFTESDESFFQLKVFLEGGVIEPPENIVVYATTNRIHLIKESTISRQGDEIHRADTIDETLSLSERFGIIITYLAPDKIKFISLIIQMAKERKLVMPEELIIKEAEKWALLKGSRSLRCAKQCLDFLESQSY
ncbi:MAG: DUF815 domain-containing protein [Oscillospiraceae bacterium]